MTKFFIIAEVIIAVGLIDSCAIDLKDRIKGQWISHETILISEKKTFDSLRIIQILDDGTYFIFGREEILGKWSLAKKKTGYTNYLLQLTVNDHSIVYEILDVEQDELVLQESSNGQGTSIRIPLKRVKL